MTSGYLQVSGPVVSGSAIAPDRRQWWAPLAGVAPGVLLLGLTVGRTPGMMWDSVEYCAAATAFASRGTLTTPLATSFDGQFDAAGHVITPHAFVLWPPGYPLAVGTIARVLAVDVKFAAVVVSVASLVVMLLSVLAILTRATDRATAVATTALLGVLPAIQDSFRRALSEPIFLACCAVMLYALTRWFDDSRQSLRWSWLAAIAIGAAINVRFTGVLLVVVHAICAVWWLSRRRHTAAQRLATLLSVVMGPAIGSLFLLYRLQTLGCLLCESRGASTQGFVTNLRALGEAMALWLPAVYAFAGPLDTILSLALLLAVFTFWRARNATSARGSAAGVALMVAGMYTLGLVVIRTFVEFDYLDARLVAPPALTLLTVALAVAFCHVEPTARFRVAAVAVMFFAVIGTVSSRIHPWRGLSDPSFRNTSLVGYAEDVLRHRPGVAIFSDEASLLATQLGFEQPIFWMPTHGVPSLRPGERGVVILRRLPDSEWREEVVALDAGAKRLPGASGVMAWELR